MFCTVPLSKARIRDNLRSEFVWQYFVLLFSQKHYSAIIWGQNLSGNVLYCSSLRSMNLRQFVVRIGFIWQSSVPPGTASLSEAWIRRIWSEFIWQCSVLLFSRQSSVLLFLGSMNPRQSVVIICLAMFCTAALSEAWIRDNLWSEFVWQCSVLLLSRKHESAAICGHNLSGNVLYCCSLGSMNPW